MFLVDIDDSTLSGYFLLTVPFWFLKSVSGRNPKWDEVAGPVNIIPDSVSTLRSWEYVAAFGVPRLETKSHHHQWGTDKLSDLPSTDIDTEWDARQALISALNVILASGGLMLQ